jgi:secreted PhoX family phosphatase
VWHTDPDGGACFDAGDGGWIYVSNSESSSGGCSMIRFDAGGGIIDARTILSGTKWNCAGGVTPWGSWLSCEETSTGRVWECDPFGVRPAVERPALGRFNHEAAAVDPVTGYVYLTEDRPDGGFYRFVPDAPGDLSSGTLQVMTEVGGSLDWADVPDAAASSMETRLQVTDMKPFNGGEGLWYRPTYLAFTTKGDNKVWAFVPASGVLLVLYDRDATTTPSLSGVDNVTVPPEPAANHLFVAEDGGDMEICAVDGSHLDGTAYPFVQISGRPGSEVTGPAFSPDYTRLYFSSQRAPGETFEVTGPFKKG